MNYLSNLFQSFLPSKLFKTFENETMSGEEEVELNTTQDENEK